MPPARPVSVAEFPLATIEAELPAPDLENSRFVRFHRPLLSWRDGRHSLGPGEARPPDAQPPRPPCPEAGTAVRLAASTRRTAVDVPEAGRRIARREAGDSRMSGRPLAWLTCRQIAVVVAHSATGEALQAATASSIVKLSPMRGAADDVPSQDRQPCERRPRIAASHDFLNCSSRPPRVTPSRRSQLTPGVAGRSWCSAGLRCRRPCRSPLPRSCGSACLRRCEPGRSRRSDHRGRRTRATGRSARCR